MEFLKETPKYTSLSEVPKFDNFLRIGQKEF